MEQKAAEVNEAAGIHKKLAKKKKPCKEDLDKYEQLLMEWSSKDPETRGPMPSRPSSEKSSPASSPPTSPKENSTENLEWSSKDPETRGPMPSGQFIVIQQVRLQRLQKRTLQRTQMLMTTVQITKTSLKNSLSYR